MTGTGTKDDPYIPDGSWDEFLEAIAKVNDPDNRVGAAYVKMPPNIEYDLSKIYPDGGGTRHFWWNCMNFDGNGLVIKNGSFDANGSVSSVFMPYGSGYSSTSYKFYISNVSFLDIQLTNPDIGERVRTFSLFGCVCGKSSDQGNGNTRWAFTNCEFRTNHTGGSTLTMYGSYSENAYYKCSEFVSCNFDITTNNTWRNSWVTGYAQYHYKADTYPAKFTNCKIQVETAVPYNPTSDPSNSGYGSMSCKNCYFSGTVGRFLYFYEFINSILNIDLADGVKDNNGTLLTDWEMVANNLNGVSGGEPKVGFTVGSVAKKGPTIYRNNGYTLPRLPAEDLTNPKALHDAGLPIDPGE